MRNKPVLRNKFHDCSTTFLRNLYDSKKLDIPREDYIQLRDELEFRLESTYAREEDDV